jgi:predicted Fe-Mo cluster-binding NifX family protein
LRLFKGKDEFRMKIAVSAVGPKLEDLLDQRFGRAGYFLIVETDSMEYQVVENPGAAAGGAGVQATQIMVDHGVGAVITGSVGPNAMQVLRAAGIPVYTSGGLNVKEALRLYQEGVLLKIEEPVPAHSGMQTENSQGR